MKERKSRPTPESLLAQAKAEERQSKRGKLKIYLGAAPGVGKTYAMLQDAIAKHKQGLDVVVGVAESHGRNEIEQLLFNLHVLPKKAIAYRNQTLHEFDLDAALQRHPGLILIDEMAHTNAPETRHKKRWQDIKEILDCGIDVWTTLNVQHVESRSDIAAQILHISIKETVPDSMLELADTIELIDLPPEDLLKRLQEGKVYFPDTAELAKENFFRKGNLITLRELALRIAAELVGTQVLLYRQGQGVQDIWPTQEKILVCVGANMDSIKLLRKAKVMATHLKAKWIAVHVNSPRHPSSPEQHNQITQNLRFAEQLGAETKVLTGFDIVKTIMHFAHEQNITQIMTWKHIHTRWIALFSRSLADEIVRHSGEIDVYVMTGQRETENTQPMYPTKHVVPWKIYGITLGVIAFITIANLLLYPYLKSSSLIMAYLLGVTMVAMFGKTGPSILASVLSVLTYDFFFLSPQYGFAATDLQSFFTLMVMLLVGLLISHFSILSRQETESIRKVEKVTMKLHKLTEQLAHARGIDNLLSASTLYLEEIFDSQVTAFIPGRSDLMIRGKSPSSFLPSAKEIAIAKWVYGMGQMAGLGTDTLSTSESLYLPLNTYKGVVGVLRIQPHKPRTLFTQDQLHLLESCANQIALSLEAEYLQRKGKKT